MVRVVADILVRTVVTGALAWLAGSGAAEVFGGLRAGQLVWLGSVTPPVWLDGPCAVEADFDLLGTARLRFV